MSSLGNQIAPVAQTPCCRLSDLSAAITKVRTVAFKARKWGDQRATSVTQLQSSRHSASGNRGLLNRREMVMIMLSGATLLSLGVAADAHAAAGEIESPEEAATNPLIQKLLEKSRTNKAVNDQARLDDYYRRNYKDYFEFVEGSVRNKQELTPAEKAILEWLQKNR